MHINFVLNVSPECDCLGYSDSPVCPDIGILAAYDPVALDQACLDLVDEAPLLGEDRFKQSQEVSSHKFECLFPYVDIEHLLEYAVQIGLGNRGYELIAI